jgi:hypothetical protein
MTIHIRVDWKDAICAEGVAFFYLERSTLPKLHESYLRERLESNGYKIADTGVPNIEPYYRRIVVTKAEIQDRQRLATEVRSLLETDANIDLRVH